MDNYDRFAVARMRRTRVSRRVLLGRGMAGVAALAVLAACGITNDGSGNSGDVTKIKFGWIPGITGGAIAAIADDQGLWEKAGLDTEAISFTSGPALVTAMGAGQLDCGYVGVGGLWGAAIGHAKIIAVESYGNETFILARPGSGIDGAADLRGKRVGVPEGSAGDFLLHLALESAKMTDADIKKISMDPATIVSAFSSGQIDAAAIWTPPAAQIQKSVPGTKVILGNPDFPEIKFPGAILASPDLLKKNPEAVRRCAQVFIEANDYRLANLDETVKISSKFTGIPEDQLAAAAKNIKFLSSKELDAVQQSGEAGTWFSQIMDLNVAVGKLPGVPDVKNYADFSFFHDALRREK